MKKLIIISILVGVLGLLIGTVPVSAHVVVKPNQVGVGAFQTFSMGVPNEKDIPTTQIRLLIPAGLKSVTPTVKNGWTIDLKKSDEGADAVVTEIDWSGGTIPAGQRDEFGFSAQVPSGETTLKWKAYQTYRDGEMVEWTHDPSTDPEDDSAPAPYSMTKVVNDLETINKPSQTSPTNTANNLFSTVALVLSAVAIALQMRRK